MAPTASSRPEDRVWPWAITIGLLVVIAVNAVFAYVAIRGADSVVPSYATETR